MGKKKGLTELDKLIIIRDSYLAALTNLDHERASQKFPLQVGFRTGYGYAMEIKGVVEKYDQLIEKEINNG
ncbi:hypothetical protein NVP1121O_105 [Vibrio phage 1.121.O._10N.286.46.C4]|nr:hypothetical protein NVP1121O_105 [Vibrio phage 1.121.O._10N.286.46.C4]